MSMWNDAGAPASRNNASLRLWVPAFAGTTKELAQMLLEKLRCATPGDLGGGAIVRARAAHAEAGQTDLGAVASEILRGAAHGLRGGVDEIERVHLFAGGIGVVIRHHLALVEIGRQGVEAGHRKAIAQPLDLLLQSPPFLDHHHTRRVAARGVGEIAAGVLAVRTLETDAGAHGFLRD